MAVVTEVLKEASRDRSFSRSDGLRVLRHFLSAALRVVRRARTVSVSHGRGCEGLAGLVTSGHRLLRHEVSVEVSESLAVSTSSEDSLLARGKTVATADAKLVGGRLHRFRLHVTKGGGWVSARVGRW